MKRINYAGGTLETGDAVAQAMVEYITSVGQSEMNITVDIPVREPSGGVATHSLVLGPGTQLDITDVAATAHDEVTTFPVPQFNKPVDLAASEPPEDAARAAREFDKAVADIEHELDHGDDG